MQKIYMYKEINNIKYNKWEKYIVIPSLVEQKQLEGSYVINSYYIRFEEDGCVSLTIYI